MAEVAKHYPHAISPVTIAWVNLATCAGMIYVPRVYMIAKRTAPAKGPKPQPMPQPQPMAQPAPDNEAAQPVPQTARVFVMPLPGAIPGEVGAGA